jgi:hypothetical protein
MPANTAPIFPLTPQVSVGALLSTAATAAKAYDGTDAVGANMALLCTAGVNGARIDKVRIKYSGTAGAAPSGTTASTVVRFFINNGSVNTTAANNTFFADVSVPSVVMSNTNVNGEFEVPLNVAIPAGYKLYANNSVAVGGTACALALTALLGDF